MKKYSVNRPAWEMDKSYIAEYGRPSRARRFLGDGWLRRMFLSLMLVASVSSAFAMGNSVVKDNFDMMTGQGFQPMPAIEYVVSNGR
jgi:hypothetical protein